ncbi:uncharacterized protein VTP21DRAFT_5017 [Calcarisporiella thermophila]|uniref:uncharacterized protein n=1 Tax=Calcarisporiella thermophila TaxID=911321 RepID=UPI00374417DF
MTKSTSIGPIPEFPVHGLMPKEDTEASSFIKKHPNFDGRGIVVAILDTGLDPAAAGMQVTTEGKPKVLDIIDCTGSGDVTTTTIVKPTLAEVDGKSCPILSGLSGRTLTLNPEWKNPTGEYRLGIKRAWELFPSSLVKRLTQERREKFEIEHHRLLAEARSELATFEQSNPSVPSDSPLATKKADLEARIEVLKEFLKSYDDAGPVFDVVVFHDGETWRVVVDTMENGDLRTQKPLTDFRKEREFSRFTNQDLLSFSVNIYDNGDLVSIVTMAGSHGTHVASIVAACHPEEPALNGMAPGAQIVSLKIGDTRLGSLETGTGFARAAEALITHKCDVANMSYGEAASLPTFGYFAKLLRTQVIGRLPGCIFVCSAGNEGPCVSTIGAPAGMWAGMISVGAHVSYSQQQAEYALLDYVPEQAYTWSSRGPTVDGYKGVDVYAPGSAIASLPVYGLQKSQLANGTSMSSPNCAGCVALLVSALKAEGMDWTPYRVRAALVQTTKDIGDPMGVGLIQVEKAWAYLEKFREYKELDMMFDVTCMGPGLPSRSDRGIYLREHDAAARIQTLTCSAKPVFMLDPLSPNDSAIPASDTSNRTKFDLDMRLALTATASWVRCPDFLAMGSSGRDFPVKVDPTCLPTDGGVHYAEVQAFDTKCPERGPVFTLPVTVLKSIQTEDGRVEWEGVKLGPGEIIRKFVNVPAGATFGELVVKNRNDGRRHKGQDKAEETARLWVRVMQLVPHTRFTHTETSYELTLAKGSYASPSSPMYMHKKRFALQSNTVVEICLAQFWSSPGEHTLDVDLSFGGVQVIAAQAGGAAGGEGRILLNGGDGVTRIDVEPRVRFEENVNPSITLDVLRRAIRPSDASIRPLSKERDVLPTTRQAYGLVLTYTFRTSEPNTQVTARFPAIQDRMYDHFLRGVFGILTDAGGQVMGYLDIYPRNIKLPKKGEYTLRMQLTSEVEDMLEKLKSLVCLLDSNLPRSLSLDAHSYVQGAFTASSGTFGKRALDRGSRVPVYFAAPNDWSSLPKDAKLGDMLCGRMELVGSSGGKIEGGEYRVGWVVPPEPIKAKEPSDEGGRGGEKEKEDPAKALNDAVRDAKIAHAKKLSSDREAQQALLTDLLNSDPTHLPLLMTNLDVALEVFEASPSEETARRAEKAASMVVEKAGPPDEVAAFLGIKSSGAEESKEVKNKRKEMEKRRDAIIAGLRGRHRALSYLCQKGTDQQEGERKEAEELEATYRLLCQWTDLPPSSADWQALLPYLERERRALRYGNVLKALNKFLADVEVSGSALADAKKAWKMKRELVSELGWKPWEKYLAGWELKLWPVCAAPF